MQKPSENPYTKFAHVQGPVALAGAENPELCDCQRERKLDGLMGLTSTSTTPHSTAGVQLIKDVAKMLSRRAASARPLRAFAFTARRTGFVQRRCITQADIEDPDMNGGYINPPRVKRQFRDPYGDWWDKQERRNYGEPVHEDNDILGMFSPEEYTHVTPGIAFFQLTCFVGVVLGLCGVVSFFYPDTPTVPREFEDDLERELGGVGALRARAPGDE